jgi:uncharacterized protein YjbJ (UPF0337 family)
MRPGKPSRQARKKPELKSRAPITLRPQSSNKAGKLNLSAWRYADFCSTKRAWLIKSLFTKIGVARKRPRKRPKNLFLQTQRKQYPTGGRWGGAFESVKPKFNGRNTMKSSTQDNAEGKMHRVRGKIKEIVGKAIRNPDLEAEGKEERRIGKIQEKIDKIKKVFGK